MSGDRKQNAVVKLQKNKNLNLTDISRRNSMERFPGGTVSLSWVQ